MAVTTDASALANAARCYSNCIPPGQELAVLVYILAQQAGLGDVDPKELANRAKCYESCLSSGMAWAVVIYLLVQIANEP